MIITLNYSPKTPKNTSKRSCKGRLNRALSAAGSAAESPSRAESQAGSAAPSATETPRQRRNSCMFGGTFGGRNCPPETKFLFWGQASAAEGCLHKRVRRPKVPSAAEPEFLQSGRNSAPTCTNVSQTFQTCINLFYNTPNHSQSSIQVHRGLKLA